LKKGVGGKRRKRGGGGRGIPTRGGGAKTRNWGGTSEVPRRTQKILGKWLKKSRERPQPQKNRLVKRNPIRTENKTS